MNKNANYVFLVDCADINEVQVVKSFLQAQGFNPRVRDEYTRTVAPHYTNLLGRLNIEVPEDEFREASHALEERNDEMRQTVSTYKNEINDDHSHYAQRALLLAILGVILVPVFGGLYSMFMGYKALTKEKPMSSKSRNRLWLAILFNSVGFYVWLVVLMPRMESIRNLFKLIP